MSVDHFLIQKLCGGEIRLPTYALIAPVRNEVAFIEKTIFNLSNDSASI